MSRINRTGKNNFTHRVILIMMITLSLLNSNTANAAGSLNPNQIGTGIKNAFLWLIGKMRTGSDDAIRAAETAMTHVAPTVPDDIANCFSRIDARDAARMLWTQVGHDGDSAISLFNDSRLLLNEWRAKLLTDLTEDEIAMYQEGIEILEDLSREVYNRYFNQGLKALGIWGILYDADMDSAFWDDFSLDGMDIPLPGCECSEQQWDEHIRAWNSDDDGDGFTEHEGDVYDDDPSRYPDWEMDVDDDGDGFAETDGDCDDMDNMINPGSEDEQGDGIDSNCDGLDV